MKTTHTALLAGVAFLVALGVAVLTGANPTEADGARVDAAADGADVAPPTKLETFSYRHEHVYLTEGEGSVTFDVPNATAPVDVSVYFSGARMLDGGRISLVAPSGDVVLETEIQGSIGLSSGQHLNGNTLTGVRLAPGGWTVNFQGSDPALRGVVEIAPAAS